MLKALYPDACKPYAICDAAEASASKLERNSGRATIGASARKYEFPYLVGDVIYSRLWHVSLNNGKPKRGVDVRMLTYTGSLLEFCWSTRLYECPRMAP